VNLAKRRRFILNKNDILEKSRRENKNLDLYEKEVSQKAGNISAVVAAILATIFYVIQILVGLGENYGLYAVVASVPATGYLIKAIQMKQRKDIIAAIIFIIVALSFSVFHINQLITTSTIL
jgi:ABC-type multidrug transport system permease subunit